MLGGRGLVVHDESKESDLQIQGQGPKWRIEDPKTASPDSMCKEGNAARATKGSAELD